MPLSPSCMQCCREVAQKYPEITYEDVIIGNCCLMVIFFQFLLNVLHTFIFNWLPTYIYKDESKKLGRSSNIIIFTLKGFTSHYLACNVFDCRRILSCRHNVNKLYHRISGNNLSNSCNSFYLSKLYCYAK